MRACTAILYSISTLSAVRVLLHIASPRRKPDAAVATHSATLRHTSYGCLDLQIQQLQQKLSEALSSKASHTKLTAQVADLRRDRQELLLLNQELTGQPNRTAMHCVHGCKC